MQGNEPIDEGVATTEDVQQEQPPVQGEDTAVDVAALQAELEEAKAKAEENWNTVLRLKAEEDNLRKRSLRDLENAHKFALDKFVDELLPVKDSLELGLNAATDTGDASKLSEGMELTLKMMTSAIGKFGVQELNPVGEQFNPEHHQAMSMQASVEQEPNTVLMVMQKGYLLNERLVRPAMVIVAKAPE